jgi:type I restriction enzyme M protein
VPLAEIEANDFNLNLPRYIDSTEPEDLQDIEAHLKGGIPNADIDGLAAYWQVFPNVRRELFADAGNRPGYSQPQGRSQRDQGRHLRPPRIHRLQPTVTTLFGTWKAANTPLLTGINKVTAPRR